MFAVGDIADTGAQKAARPSSAQAAVITKSIQALIKGHAVEDTFVKGPGAIHLTLGMGQTEPCVKNEWVPLFLSSPL
ncbi:hypothetical protein N7445_008103 [Penicillium cf. griseofulvum]|nr:hypothetical protein N7445_008103 [Penicillium cf. griseofulvum]